MSQRKITKTEGHHLAGNVVTVDSEINFVTTVNPEIDSSGGDFIHKVKTASAAAYKLRDDVSATDIVKVDSTVGAEVITLDAELTFAVTTNPEIDSSGGDFVQKIKTASTSAYKLRDDTKAQDVMTVDTVNDTLTINAPYTPVGFAPTTINTVATTLSSWILDAGTIYYADIAHNLGTDDILLEIFDSVTKESVQVEKIDRITTNTVRIFIEGNTASLRVIVADALPNYIGSSGRNVISNPATPYIPSNNDIILWDCTSGNKVINLPAAASSNDFRIDIKKLDVTANTLLVDPNGAELIEFGPDATLTSQGEAISITCDGTAWYILASL